MSAVTPGAKVTIRGLSARPDLNGLTGVVEKWDAGQSRWEATLHTVLCAIHHESGTKLLAAKKYHFIEPGPPMMARCKADTPLTSTFASLGLTGRVALNLGESEA